MLLRILCLYLAGIDKFLDIKYASVDLKVRKAWNLISLELNECP